MFSIGHWALSDVGSNAASIMRRKAVFRMISMVFGYINDAQATGPFHILVFYWSGFCLVMAEGLRRSTVVVGVQLLSTGHFALHSSFSG